MYLLRKVKGNILFIPTLPFIYRLLEIQTEFKEEKQKLHSMMNEKNAVILAQEGRMNALEKTNNHLLTALDQIRES